MSPREVPLTKIILTTVLILTLALASCSDGGGGNSNKTGESGVTISGDVLGKWKSTYGGKENIYDITATTWTQTMDGSFFDSGTYTTWDGKTATIYSSGLKAVVGTATLDNNTTMTVVLKSPSLYPGTYTFTKM